MPGDPSVPPHSGRTTPVGYYDGNQTPPGDDMANGYGLYDMAGNVDEWCNDWYASDYYSVSPPDNPRGPATGTYYRIRRGGSWNRHEDFLRCSDRNGHFPGEWRSSIGFRLVLDAE